MIPGALLYANYNHGFYALFLDISYLRRLVAAEFLGLLIRSSCHFVFGEHVLHLHCLFDGFLAGGNFLQFLIGGAG